MMDILRKSAEHLEENFMTYAIAVSQMAVILVFMTAGLAGLAGIISSIFSGLHPYAVFRDLMETWLPLISSGDLIFILTSVFILIVIPVFAIGAWVMTPVFGMSKQLTESKGREADTPFSWFTSHLVNFALGGITIATTVLGPAVLTAAAFSFAFGGTVSGPANVILGAIGFGWVFFAGGVQTMYVPSLIEGKSPIEALKHAIRTTAKHPLWTFTSWMVFLFLFAIWFAPLAIWNMLFGTIMTPMSNPLAIAVVALAVIGVFVDIVLILPFYIIALNLLYQSIMEEAPP
ncbi:MAG: hypothetical protein KGY80_04775 [Candidatus Thorarchaeota archaeon]|nr:hypothetical protein [Candidatus Thorarchaeota archaeon]